ncbi:MAG: alpha-L-fucosidase [Bacteroidales bacterium]
MLSSLASPVLAQTNYVPTTENLKAREEFRDNKFGIFLHFGLYSMLADGEWIMTNKNLNHKEYAKLAGGFYPSNFNADEWVAAIKASGAKYICITTRHHDGFSLFDTKFSDFNIMKATPFKRDIIKELSEACRKHDIKLHLYYSLLDWSREDYYPLGRTGKGTGRTSHGEWKTYDQFMNNQLSELLTNYGDIGAIWLDGWWDHDQHPDFDWQFPKMYANIHNLQPTCLIGNNHHITPFEGEDLQIFERDLPGENSAGLSGQNISPLPLETCNTMNGMWGYKIVDQNYKSPRTLIHYLVKAAGMNANLLMNIGPQPDGSLPAISIERMKEVGDWMKIYGETIYGTRGGIISPRDWGVTTQKGNKLYVHILNLQDNALFIPLKDTKVKKALLYKDKSQVSFKQDKDGLVLKFAEVPGDIDYIVELEL